MKPLSPRSLGGLRIVALFEALKGAIVIAAGFGLLTLLHRDVRQIAESLVTRLHIDPDRRYPGLFLEAASHVSDARLLSLAGLAALYAALRLLEAYGLWFERRWAAWLGAASGGIYIPVEIYELIERPSWVKAATLTLNVGVVVYLLGTLSRSMTPLAVPTANVASATSSPRKPPL